MCMVSMVVDNFNKTTDWQPFRVDPIPSIELDSLKREIESLKKVLIAAKLYDEETDQKDCEKEELVAALKLLAKHVGVDLEDVL